MALPTSPPHLSADLDLAALPGNIDVQDVEAAVTIARVTRSTNLENPPLLDRDWGFGILGRESSYADMRLALR